MASRTLVCGNCGSALRLRLAFTLVLGLIVVLTAVSAISIMGMTTDTLWLVIGCLAVFVLVGLFIPLENRD